MHAITRPKIDLNLFLDQELALHDPKQSTYPFEQFDQIDAKLKTLQNRLKNLQNENGKCIKSPPTHAVTNKQCKGCKCFATTQFQQEKQLTLPKPKRTARDIITPIKTPLKTQLKSSQRQRKASQNQLNKVHSTMSLTRIDTSKKPIRGQLIRVSTAKKSNRKQDNTIFERYYNKIRELVNKCEAHRVRQFRA